MLASHLNPARRELLRVREREIELKRLNGELSCMECRRNKSGCDKKVPCTTCIKHGCADICPLGTLPDRSYKKPVLIEALMPHISELDKRLDRLQAMQNRITVLEDALYLHTDGTHNLLADNLARTNHGGIQDKTDHSGSSADQDHPVKSFGTLSIGYKTMHYIGSSSTESVIREKVHTFEDLRRDLYFFQSPLPDDLIQASSLFPFVPACFAKPSTYAKLLSHLPSYARATGLVEAYFTNLSWYTICIEREQVRDDLLPMFYPNLNHHRLDPSLFREELLHDLGLLFAMFAIGAVADLTQHFLNEEAETLERLARCTLGLRSIFEHGSLAACQAVALLSTYDAVTDRKKSERASSSLVASGLKIALSIGLHLDPERWALEPHIVQRRRSIFWQLNSIDKMRSVETGHPPIFKSEAIACKFPDDRFAIREVSGRVVETVWRWRHRFTRDCLTPLSELMSDARPLQYSRILEIGTLLQAQEHHPYSFTGAPKSSAFSNNPMVYAEDGFNCAVHPVVSVWWKQIAIQRLHRNCFARAIIENPANPYESIYAPSFLAVFDSTKIMLKIAIQSYNSSKPMLRRLHNIWGNVAVGGVIVGIIACRVKIPGFRDEAHELLEQLIALFERATEVPVFTETLWILKDLWRRSKESYETDSAPGPARSQLFRKVPNIAHAYRDADDELLLMSGYNAHSIFQQLPENIGRHSEAFQNPLPNSLSTNTNTTSQHSQDTHGTYPSFASSIYDRTDEIPNSKEPDRDAFAWLGEHEKDEEQVAWLSAFSQKLGSTPGKGLAVAGIEARPTPLSHGPGDIETSFGNANSLIGSNNSASTLSSESVQGIPFEDTCFSNDCAAASPLSYPLAFEKGEDLFGKLANNMGFGDICYSGFNKVV